MKSEICRRRRFLKSTTVATAGLFLGGHKGMAMALSNSSTQPALLGGKPVRTERFPSWPVIEEQDEKAWMQALRARRWFRGNGVAVEQFEEKFANLMGARGCLATANGTSALFTALNALEIGPGDEVIVPPYTFVATINVVLLQYALPVFVDTDLETFQIDAGKLEAAVTDQTRCVVPVHLGGNSCDLDRITAVGKKHNLSVVEDACQAHLAEWKGKKVGLSGSAGCFSFQVSKNLSSGEGGAIISDDTELLDRCFSFHSNGREKRGTTGFSYRRNGCNLRMTEFQGTLLQQQMTRLEEQSSHREQNAAYLTKQLGEIQGIRPARQYDGCTRNAYHLYMLRYAPERFAGMSRDRFLQAMRAEGIPCSGGYSPLNKEPFLRETLHSRGFLTVFGRERIDKYFERIECPQNDQLCRQAVWFTQPMLLGTREDMDQIVEAVRKLQKHAGELVRL